MLILDEFARLFSFGLFERLRRFSCDSSLFLLHLDRSFMSDFIKDTLRSEFFGSALRVNSTVKHAHYIVCTRKDKLDVMSDEYLGLFNGLLKRQG
jgi:hypothetical protein